METQALMVGSPLHGIYGQGDLDISPEVLVKGGLGFPSQPNHISAIFPCIVNKQNEKAKPHTLNAFRMLS